MKKVLISLCAAIIVVLSLSCAKKDAAGQSKDHNTVSAMQALKAKAQTGDPNAQYQLGLAYYSGNGVGKDYKEALKWFTMAAKQGNASAQYGLAIMYEKGNGVIEDTKEALKWYRMAAEQGVSRAQVNLGMMYAQGQGVEKNYKEAVKWFNMAARQGDAVAQCNLAILYATGPGVQDFVKGYKWALLADMSGQDIGKTKAWLKERMTGTQIVEAQQLAKAYVEEKQSQQKPTNGK